LKGWRLSPVWSITIWIAIVVLPKWPTGIKRIDIAQSRLRLDLNQTVPSLITDKAVLLVHSAPI
jgi:hypothetical protein